jgi:hypothetical protein
MAQAISSWLRKYLHGSVNILMAQEISPWLRKYPHGSGNILTAQEISSWQEKSAWHGEFPFSTLALFLSSYT